MAGRVEAGMDDFVAEPVTLDVLVELLKRWLKKIDERRGRAGALSTMKDKSPELRIRFEALKRAMQASLFAEGNPG
jgi:hypothetical protein